MITHYLFLSIKKYHISWKELLFLQLLYLLAFALLTAFHFSVEINAKADSYYAEKDEYDEQSFVVVVTWDDQLEDRDCDVCEEKGKTFVRNQFSCHL